MGDYTKLNLQNIKEIVEIYNDEEVVEFRPLSLGISNSSYEIRTSNGHFLLKVSNDKNADQVRQEMEILSFLNKADYEYSILPFSTKTGELVYRYADSHGALFPFVEGIPPGPNDNTCFQIGVALAKLHNISGDTTDLRPSEELSFPANVIHSYIDKGECPSDFKEVYKRLLGVRANEYLEQDFAKGIIHGDLYYDNSLFDKNYLTAVLDFEQSGVGNLILDLGISISGCCIEKGRISLPLLKSYLKGYESQRLLPENENDFLNEAVIYGLLSISLWRIKRFTVGDLNPLMADSYKELLYRAEIFKQMVTQ